MAGTRASKNSRYRLEAAVKQGQALELKLAGITHDQIAKTLGYKGHSSVSYAIEAALKRTLEKPSEYYRKLTLRRLTKLLSMHWLQALRGELYHTDRCLKIIRDMRELLGLDAPIQAEVSSPGSDKLELNITGRETKDVDLENLDERATEDAIWHLAEADRILRDTRKDGAAPEASGED